MAPVLKIAALSLSAATIASGLLFLIALDSTDQSVQKLPGFVLAAGQDRLANRLLLRNSERGTSQAYQASISALREAPYDTTALLRLAYIDRRRDGALSQPAQLALRTSYDRVPIDPEIGFWRVRFCLENWEFLPSDLRLRAQTEVFAMASEPGHRWPLRKLLRTIDTPYGSLVASFWGARIAALAGGG